MTPHKAKETMKSFRQGLFVGAAGLLLAMIWTLTWFELIMQMGLSPTIRTSILIFFCASYCIQILYLFLMRNPKLNSIFVFCVFFIMGLFIHLFFAGLTKDILIFIPFLSAYEKILSQLFALLAVLISLAGTLIAFQGPKIRSISIPIDKRFQSLNGLKIVQISDLHVGPLIGKNYVEKVVQLTNQLQADLVVLTGDIGDSNPKHFGSELAPLKQLKSTYGGFFVTGNHEYYWNAEEWIQAIVACKIHPLLNQGVSLLDSQLWLGGITDPDGARFIPNHAPNPKQALDNEKSRLAYKILLAHQPKNCFAAEKAGFDLMLSGHTHGGQFFPFNLLVGFFNPYSKGLNRHRNMLVYVNLGTGFWGPALRLGVTAEITLLKLAA